MLLASVSVDLKGYELAAAYLLSRWPCTGATDNRARDRTAVVLEVRRQHLAEIVAVVGGDLLVWPCGQDSG